MRLIFAGTPEFAATALAGLHAAGHDIALVLTQPDRPAGRGMKLQASAVKQWAQAHGITVMQPRGLRLDGRFPQDAALARDAITAAAADAMVVAAYGLILPDWVLRAPRLGCLNIHASLLPRWRGAAPIHRAIEAGDLQTGITIMQMDQGLDTGDMLLVGRLDIGPEETTGALHDRLAPLGAQLVVQALRLAAGGELHPVAQPASGVTYAHKIEKGQAQLDFRRPAALLARQVRAFDPFPGAYALWHGEPVKVWRARALDEAAALAAGTVLAAGPAGIEVCCGQGVLRLTELQRAGGRRLPAADFLRGHPIAAGALFDLPVG